jgi:hypothetical protein
MTDEVALDTARAEPTGTTGTFTSVAATPEERSGNC